jgi:hypothetical protein
MGYPGQSAEFLGLHTSYEQILCQGSGSRALQPLRVGGREKGERQRQSSRERVSDCTSIYLDRLRQCLLKSATRVASGT